MTLVWVEGVVFGRPVDGKMTLSYICLPFYSPTQASQLTGTPSFYQFRCTLGFLTKIYFTLLLYHPGRCLGCPEKWKSSRNYNLFVWSAVFQPKWNDIQKSYKNHQNPLKSYCFLVYFQSLLNFGWKTAAQNN